MTSHGPDLLLVHPGGRKQVYQSLEKNLSAIESPVWAGLMATYARLKGFSVELLDADAEGLSAEQTAQEISRRKPLLTALVVYGHQPSASTQTMPGAGAVAVSLKALQPELKLVMVGGHVAALPERSLKEEKVDFIVGGEGPVTIGELVQALKAGGSAADLRKVKGLWYWEDGRICANAPAPLVKDLDTEMPGMAWDMLPMKKYRAHNWHCMGGLDRQPYASLYTTLGCPFHCSFCCIQAPYKSGEKVLGMKESVNSYRFWDPKGVVDQLEVLVKTHGVRNVKFADEMFVLNVAHISAICDGIIERKLDLNIWAYARVDTVKDSMLDKLLKAGIRWLAFGIESANEQVRQDVQKGFGHVEIAQTIRKVQDSGIQVIGNYIFGLPEDSRETMQETLKMAQDLNCEFANFYAAMAYPGSALYTLALEQGWSLPESWSGYSQHSEDSLPLPTKHLTSGEVLEFRDQAFQRYFGAPGYQAMITKKFGAKTAREIREMSSVQLVRKHAASSGRKVIHSA